MGRRVWQKLHGVKCLFLFRKQASHELSAYCRQMSIVYKAHLQRVCEATVFGDKLENHKLILELVNGDNAFQPLTNWSDKPIQCGCRSALASFSTAVRISAGV